MMVGMLVLPRGTVGMIEASTTRRPSTPRTRPAGSTTASRSSGAHAAGADRMERAGDVLADVLVERLSVLDQLPRSTPVGERGEHRVGEPRHEVDQRGEIAALQRLAESALSRRIRSVKFTGKVSRPCRGPARGRGSRRRGGSPHEAREVELVTAEVEFDERRLPVGGARATRGRAPSGSSSTGARLATCAPSAFHDVLLWMLM